MGGGWGGDGPQACKSWLRRYPEYEKPLGEPKGAATITNGTWGNVYTREFASGTKVYVGQYLEPDGDWQTGQSKNYGRCVFWADGYITGNASRCPPPALVTQGAARLLI